jgi:hypothetical protein
VQAATMLILVLAANTAYADFPRLASIVARDRFLPRQFMNQGDRLAFSNGIVILSVLASVLLVVFGGDTHALIPLYMIGVFVSFTLSQAGMVLHWRTLRGRAGARVRRSTVSAPSSPASCSSSSPRPRQRKEPDIIVRSRYWSWFRDHASPLRPCRIGAHAAWFEADPVGRHVVLVPNGGIQRAVVKALQYARTLSSDVRAGLRQHRSRRNEPFASNAAGGQRVALVVLESPFRSLMEPLLEYIEQVQASDPNGYVTVILPEFVRAACGSTFCTISTRCSSRAHAVQAERRGDQRAVPSGPARTVPVTASERTGDRDGDHSEAIPLTKPRALQHQDASR